MKTFLLTLLLTGLVWTWNTASAVEINVLGPNGVAITHNDMVPSTVDETFFGVTTLGDGQSLTKTFTIENTDDDLLNGFVPLVLGDVSIGQSPDINFYVTQQPDEFVYFGAPSTFEVTFSPNSGGILNAVVSIPSSDSNEDPYTFAIQATVRLELRYSAGVGGTISGAALQTRWSTQTGSPVAAVPNAGYFFAGWSDGVADNPRTDTAGTQNLDVTAKYFAYTSSGSEITITDCDDCLTGELTIPDTIDGLPVTSIGANAFDRCRTLTRVTIPEGVTSIGNYAFYDCTNLTGVTIPDGVTSIGDYTFWQCANLVNVSIPDGVTSIGDYAFDNCFKLTSVVLPDSLKSIGASAFCRCALGGVAIPNGVTTIGEAAFKGNPLASLTIPQSVTSIGASAFEECGLPQASVVIPDGVTSIEDKTFRACGLASIMLPDNVTSIGDNAFHGCALLMSIVIPEGVTSIGEGAFSECESLTSIVIPDSVTTLGSDVCHFCTNLISVELGTGLTSISARAFAVCASLRDVTIGPNVERIEDSAFIDCQSLREIDIPESSTAIERYAFYNTNLVAINIPDNVVTVGDRAFASCNALSTAVIGNGVTSIGVDAFYDCANMTSISMGSSITFIAGGAFRDCYSLQSITIPEGVPFIAVGVFENCENLETAIIAESVTSIDRGAFRNCYSLKNITIPEGVTDIWDAAFHSCIGLDCLEIPASVTRIGEEAFGSSGIVSLFFKGDAPQVDEDGIDLAPSNATIFHTARASGFGSYFGGVPAFAIRYTSTATDATIAGCDTAATGTLVIPATLGGLPVTTIGSSAFRNCSDLERVKIPHGVTRIEENAFQGCSTLISMAIPDSVTSIGSRAFEGCSDLQSITIPARVTNIGDFAFVNCTRLSEIVFEGDAPTTGLDPFSNIPSDTTVAALDPAASGFVYGGTYGGLPVTGLDPHADPYGTGVSNFLTYAFFGTSRDPSTVRTEDLPQLSSDGSHLIVAFTKPDGVSNITYGAEWSSTLGDDWQDVADSDPDTDGFQFAVPIDGIRRFLRWKVVEN